MTVPRFFLPVFCLLLLLAACGQQTEAGPEAAPTPDPTPGTAAPADPAPAQNDADVQPAFAPVSPGTDAGYYLFKAPAAGTTRSLLCYIDYGSAQMLPLCAKPQCSHSDESCTACALGQMWSPDGLFAVGDTLYLLQEYADRDSGCLLMAAGLDGSDPHTLLGFDPVYYQLLTPCTDGETLYLLGRSLDETAAVVHSDLLRVDLANGDCTVAMQFTDGANYMLCGGQGQALVLDRAEGTEHTRQLFDPATGNLSPAADDAGTANDFPPSDAPLYRDSPDGPVQIVPLAAAGEDFLVVYAREETLTDAGLDSWPRYALIAQADYYAGIPNWRPITEP